MKYMRELESTGFKGWENVEAKRKRVEYVFKVMIIMMNHGVKGSRGKKEIWKDD